MKIIDMNVCIGKADVHGKNIDLQALLQMMEQNNIEHAVAYHEYALAEHKSGNALMQKISEESNGKVGVCAVIDPGLGADSLPGDYHGDLTAKGYAYAMDFADEVGCPVLCHI